MNPCIDEGSNIARLIEAIEKIDHESTIFKLSPYRMYKNTKDEYAQECVQLRKAGIITSYEQYANYYGINKFTLKSWCIGGAFLSRIVRPTMEDRIRCIKEFFRQKEAKIVSSAKEYARIQNVNIHTFNDWMEKYKMNIQQSGSDSSTIETSSNISITSIRAQSHQSYEWYSEDFEREKQLGLVQSAAQYARKHNLNIGSFRKWRLRSKGVAVKAEADAAGSSTSNDSLSGNFSNSSDDEQLHEQDQYQE